jgi:hypothetical protein
MVARIGPSDSEATKTDDITGILVLRHLLSEVICSFTMAGLHDLSGKLEEALRLVQPQASQTMGKRSGKETTSRLRS